MPPLAALAAAGCTALFGVSSEASAQTPGTVAAATQNALSPASVRSSNLPAPAPAWALPSAAGGALASTNFAGKVIVLNFFDTTCDACSNEVPNLVLLQKKYGADGLQVIGVAVDPSPDNANPPVAAVASFGSLMHVNYPLALAHPFGTFVETSYGAIAFPNYGYGLELIPATFVINRQNQVVQTFVNGAQTYSTFEAAVKPQLALSANPSLQVSVLSGKLTLSWLVTPTSFGLESTADLSKPEWSRLPASAVVSDRTNNLVSLSLTTTSKFFRLISP